MMAKFNRKHLDDDFDVHSIEIEVCAFVDIDLFKYVVCESVWVCDDVSVSVSASASASASASEDVCV